MFATGVTVDLAKWIIEVLLLIALLFSYRHPDHHTFCHIPGLENSEPEEERKETQPRIRFRWGLLSQRNVSVTENGIYS